MFSQENTKTTITVVGESAFAAEIDKYHITVTLKKTEDKSLSEVTQIYNDQLKGLGINFSTFHKNIPLELMYAQSYIKDVMYYTYTTTSQEEMIHIIKQKMEGLTIFHSEVTLKKKSNDEWATIAAVAIEDALMKAEKIAHKLNKKLGNIINIQNPDSSLLDIDLYRPEELQKHLVTVTFDLQ